MRRARPRSPRPTTWTQLPLEEPARGAPPAAPPPPVAGEWVDALVTDLAIELGAAGTAAAYRVEVRRLWEESRLPEREFAKILLEVRGRATSWRGRVDHARSGAELGLRRKACLLMLRDRLGLIEAADRRTLQERRRRLTSATTAANR